MVADVAGRIAYLCDAQVDIGREPPVQVGLPRARLRPRRQACEVEETQVHRLLELVGAIPGEVHGGRGSLGHVRVRFARDHHHSNPATGWPRPRHPARLVPGWTMPRLIEYAGH